MINVMLVAEDTGEETVYGEVGPADAWWSVPLPPCPSCNGLVEWAEAGQVPGTRRCAECRRFYRLRTIDLCPECQRELPGGATRCKDCDPVDVE